ncbi:phosphoenolpyruvate synthase, partial [Candidatus Woesearchaeota archaeon CG10_big_fil_rev_8_21_14_0_10_37_12]
ALSVGVQKMVRSDRACSGVMFTLDTESGFPDVVFITASYGLGESVVQGLVNPDEFYVFKPTLKQGFKPIVDKRLGEKETKIIYATGKNPIKTVVVSKLDRQKFCLSDAEVLMLSEWGVVIEDHYSKKKGTWVPMDIEWAKDGNGELFIVQARPETVQSQKNRNVVETYSLSQSGKVLVSGKSVGNKIAQGKVRVIKSVKDIDKFKKGDVLVTEMTDPDWVPIMKQASAIVTDHGGRTSHAAIVSRELGLPCIVGTNDATKKLKSGQNVTVSCAEGENGLVYAGFLKFKVNKVDISKAKKPKTKVMVNLGNPDQAFETGLLPNDGVGLARQEFIVNEHIKVHPLALTNFDEVRDKKTREKIEELTAGFKDKKQFFVDKLAMGVGLLGAAFYPKPVIVRLSDFKSNEYRNLIGGEFFEPEEENPMLGWRGASRYYSEKYKPAFKLECQAIRKAREEFGLTNIKVMIPMCRTIDEGKKVLATMTQFGLEQHKKELEVYVMCELPSNMILAEEFAKLFDGFSIGSNDLTQMTLGVDRDSALVADVYDERNEAVLRSVEHIIKTAKAHKTKVGICGDAPSTYPEFTKFLIDCGIDSISVSPDVLVKSRLDVVNYEKKRK